MLNRKKYLLAALLFGSLIRFAFLFAPSEFSWREAQTGMQTRNIEITSYDWLHPMMDWGGAKSTVLAMEFPLHNIIWALIDNILIGGHKLFIGRMLSLIYGIINILLIFLIGKKLSSKTVGVWAALFYSLSPLAWHLEAAANPEALWQLFSLTAIYFTFHLKESPRNYKILLIILISLSCSILIKLPQGFFIALSVFLINYYRSDKRLNINLLLLISVLIIACTAGFFWYSHMDSINRSNKAVWDFEQQSRFLIGTWSQRISPATTIRFLVRYFVYGGPPIFLLVLSSAQLIKKIKSIDGMAESYLLLFAAIMFQYAIVNGSYLTKHYQYIALPSLCLISGIMISRFSRFNNSRVFISILIFYLGWNTIIGYKLYRDNSSALVKEASKILKGKTDYNDGIIVVTDVEYLSSPYAPFIFYDADRRGITMNSSGFKKNNNTQFMDSLNRAGFKWVLELDNRKEVPSAILKKIN